MSDDDELRRQIQESLARTSPPGPADLGSVERRSHRIRTRRVFLGSTTAMLIVGAVVAPLALLSPLGGNRLPPIASVSGGASGKGSFSLLRLAERPPGGAYYIEGAYAYVAVTTVDGQVLIYRELTNYLLPSLSLDGELPPGRYLIESYVRPCDGSCGQLDAPTERCSQEFQIHSGDKLAATILYRPGQGCTISFESSPSPSVSASAIPDVAEVICDDSGTQVLTPEVKPQPDGLHFRVDNRTDKDLAFVIHDFGGDNAPVGVTDLVRGVPPGASSVVCFDPRQDTPPGMEGTYAALSIVDEEGIYVSPSLECGEAGGVTGILDYVNGTNGEIGDPVDLARAHFQGLLEGDVVQLVGYPEDPQPVVGVIRDGKTIATAKYDDDGQGGWQLGEVSRCSDSGLTG